MKKVSIVGVTGYTGEELLRILVRHENIEIAHITSKNYVGQKIQEIFPNLISYIDMECEEMDLETLAKDSDLVFAALPHGLSIPIAKACMEQGTKFIDLGADFRLKDKSVYEKWYGVEHSEEGLLGDAIYGMPELNRERIKNANIIGNPGCFPTSIILGLKPLLKNKLIDINNIVIDSKSGVSGAGRSAKVDTLFTELVDNFKAYGLPGHRHIPEIEQELSNISGDNINISFTPHLLPVDRGILSTIYVDLKDGISLEEVKRYYRDEYDKEAFVHLLPDGIFPNIKYVRGSNHVHINIALDERINKLKVVVAIDNLVKGASGQAVQNMNLLLGFEETQGLMAPGLNP